MAAAVFQSSPLQAASPADYPRRPVRIVVGFPPGGTADILARAIGRELTESWKQQVVVDNRPGAGSLIGAELVSKSAPDGYTLLMVTSSHAVAGATRSDFDPVGSFTPISLVASTALAFLAGPAAPVKSMRELLAYAKANPGALNYGSSGTGSTTHLAGELLNKAAGIRLVHVPYKGGAPSMTELVSGQIDLLVISLPSAIPQVKAARVVGLATTASARSTSLPDVPTVAESGVPGYEALQWYAILGPARMQAGLTDRLNMQIAHAVRSASLRDLLAKMGADATLTTVPEFREYLRAEVAKWSALARSVALR
jgi:tripartite-type tricarboxylate transporter receptor subunit TctC